MLSNQSNKAKLLPYFSHKQMVIRTWNNPRQPLLMVARKNKRPTVIDTTKRIPTMRQILGARLRAFGRDEGGAIIAMTLIFFLTMLVLGGIAVDFMRFESRRAMLQSTADRAVLAAAKIPEGNLPGSYESLATAQKATVVDYFEKSGFGDSIVGEPSTGVIDGYNTVSVESRFELDSLFIDMLGIDTISAPAASTALEGVSDIEISLVVDISGSMAYSPFLRQRPVLRPPGLRHCGPLQPNLSKTCWSRNMKTKSQSRSCPTRNK